MAKDDADIQPSDTGAATLPRDAARSFDLLNNAVVKLQLDGDYTKRFLTELQTDMRDVRDRLTRLEIIVSHLPNKGFIVGVVTTTMLIGGGIASGLFGLQAYLSSKQLTPTVIQLPANTPSPAAKSP